jgi:Zn-dependent M16 (insulinase) family peptidase
MSSWIYDKDPFQPLQWEDSLQHFKDRLASGEDVFGPLIERHLLANKHRVVVELKPDPALAAAEEAEEKARLKAFQDKLVQQELEEVIKTTRELKDRQETPDRPEALACVPTLHISDIPKQISTISSDISQSQGVTKLSHDLFTNDVLYLEAALDMRPIPAELLPLMPLFCRSLTQMGTEKEDFVTLSQRIGRKTGGVSFSPFTSSVKGSKDPLAFLMVRGKVMGDKSGDLLDIMRDVLLTAKLDDKERFKQMVLETKAGLEAGVVGSGHSVAAARLDAQRSIAGWVGEQMGGLSYLQYIRQLASRVDKDWESVRADMHRIKQLLLQRHGAYINMTGDETTLSHAAPHVDAFLQSLPETSAGPSSWSNTLAARNEAIVVPTQVNYVGKAANLYEDAGYKLKGSSYVINKHLGTTYIWDRVRVSGGAYGGFTDFDTHSGMYTYLSYRDPNLLKTVDVYDGTVDFLRNVDLDQDALTKAIIGTIGDVDGYMLPDAKGYTAFMRHLLNIGDEERQQRRDEILGTTVKDFREFADVLECVKGDKGRVVAVTSSERAKDVNEKERPGFFDEITRAL